MTRPVFPTEAGRLVYGSVCSGIEAASVAWHPLGWRASFLSEIEAFPRSVLAHHYPETPLHGDFTTIAAGEYEPIDLLVGGTPCQSFSVAGLRGGLDDDRGNLALEYLRLADRLRPRWLVWENVPGVLSSNGGRDFGAILGGMVELGYGFAYRVLDAQFFGVAQRRRRVFVVGHLGDWRRAAAVLFERHSLQGHPAPRREAGKDPSGRAAYGISPDCLDRSGEGAGGTAGERSGLGVDPELAYSLRAKRAGAVAAFGGGNTSGPVPVAAALAALAAHGRRQDFEVETFVTHTLKGEGYDASEDGTGRGTPIVPVCFSAKDHGADAMSDLSPTLRAGGHSKSHANAGVMPAVAFPINPNALRGDTSAKTPSRDAAGVMRLRDPGMGIGDDGDPADTLQAAGPGAVAFAQNTRDEVREMPYVGALAADAGMKQTSYIRQSSAVRRLTPRECERLQGFPDDYTLIPYRKGQAADGPRYKALGNSMAVPVMRWIGERIVAVDAMQQMERAA